MELNCNRDSWGRCKPGAYLLVRHCAPPLYGIRCPKRGWGLSRWAESNYGYPLHTGINFRPDPPADVFGIVALEHIPTPDRPENDSDLPVGTLFRYQDGITETFVRSARGVYGCSTGSVRECRAHPVDVIYRPPTRDPARL